ncbi:MAG: U32 family peptidase [Bacilli bacterium]|nr:U32 family peptidase [Bacilli bacterium]
MNNHELLIPAGDMDSLRQAVYNGADAVYLGCKLFGARKFAKNFDNDEIVEAIKFCHLYGVKIFVTMNTLVKNDEVDTFISQAKFLHEHGVDALIVQDFGMICLLREMFPNLEIHASTQFNNSSYDTCKLLYDIGVKRVVFSRELTIDQIDNIDVPIEKEAFIHGALCISYSGNCLMSSMLGGRSGNRGECAGCCRMKFNLLDNKDILEKDKYLLSTKELNTSSCIDRLLNSSIYSFKIEGRMKGPLYVGFITRFYRNLIDGKMMNFDEETNKLKTIFNREFTTGRIFDVNDYDLMNTKSPNHIGLDIGKCSIYKDKIKIELNYGVTLNQYDAIRFKNSNKGLIINFLYDEKMLLTNSATGICYVDNKIELDSDDLVSITQDYLLGKEFENISEKKINVTFNVKCKLGSSLELSISDGENTVTLEDGNIESALNVPTSKEVIIEKLSKLGDTPFVCNEFNIELDENVFVPMKILNELRRRVCEELINIRRDKIKEVIINNNITFDKFNDSDKIINNKTCYVFTEEQLKFAIDNNFERIYVKDKELFNKYKSDNLYLVIDRCSYSYDELTDNSFVSDYMDFSNKNNIIGNYSLNVFNIYTAYYLRKIGLNVIPLSVELNEYEILIFMKLFKEKFGTCKFEVLKYGRVENMIIKGNILNLDINKFDYKFEDFKERLFPVYYDGINTHIFNYEKVNLGLQDVINCYFRYDFYDEGVINFNNILMD